MSKKAKVTNLEKDTINESQEASSLNEEPPTYATLATDLEKDQLVEAVANIDSDCVIPPKDYKPPHEAAVVENKEKVKRPRAKKKIAEASAPEQPCAVGAIAIIWQ